MNATSELCESHTPPLPGNLKLLQQAELDDLARRGLPPELVLNRLAPWEEEIGTIAAKLGLAAQRIRAIAAAESEGNPQAYSGSAFGLMQVTRMGWLDVQHEYPEWRSFDLARYWTDPVINLQFGAAVYCLMQRRVAQWTGAPAPARLVHAAYNAGNWTIRLAAQYARRRGSPNPITDCLEPGHLKAAILKTGVYAYYYSGLGRTRNPYHARRFAWRARRQAAVDLKFAETMSYLARIEIYLSAH